jgi:hypothetical protein
MVVHVPSITIRVRRWQNGTISSTIKAVQLSPLVFMWRISFDKSGEALAGRRGIYP